MGVFTQLLANSIIAGAIYALVASGFSLIYATNRFVHFAHGAVIVAAAYIMYGLFAVLNINLIISIILTILLTAILGYLQFRCVYLPLKQRNSSTVVLLIASVGLMLLFENLVLLIAGSTVRTFDIFPAQRGMEVLGAVITKLQLIIIAVSIVLLISLRVLLKTTRLGKMLRAVSDNPELANISGIPAQRMQSWSFMIGSGLAAIAAILIALEQNLEPFMGTRLIIKGFTAAIVGGVNSVEGAILGSFLLGGVENFGVWYLPSGYKDAIAFVLLILFLLVRPTGILGIKRGHRA